MSPWLVAWQCKELLLDTVINLNHPCMWRQVQWHVHWSKRTAFFE